jgi:hypothetical protein
LKLEHRLTADRELLAGALLNYAASPADFISDCVYLYEPRNANAGEPGMLPVVLFPRQREFIGDEAGIRTRKRGRKVYFVDRKVV